jgi:pimeloyl-ACP methyl ester carboxylesterase
LENPLIVGHSLGGAVALTLALNHKEHVGGLALLCPATQPIDDTPEVFKGLDVSSAGVRKFIAHTVSGPLGLLMEKKIFSVIFAPEPIAPGFEVKGGGKLGRSPGAFIAASEDMVNGRSSVDEVVGREAELTMPVGVLYAEKDEILNPKLHGGKFAELSGADLQILPGRGHMIPLTAPDECAAFIRDMASKSA